MNEIQKLPDGMILHCGGEVADRDSIAEVLTPEPTESWFPLSHDYLIEQVEMQLNQTGFIIEAETHSLAKEGE